MSDSEEECKPGLCLDFFLGLSSSPIPEFRRNLFDTGETSSSSRRKTEVVSDGNSYSIPHDLLMDIARELPVKALLRFLCVSKLWESTIRSREFNASYFAKSLIRPQTRQGLIFTFVCGENCFVFSSPRPEIEDEASSSSSVASYNMMCHSESLATVSPSVHGLICYGPASELSVYNPCTRRSLVLPRIDSRKRINHFIGYDPIGNNYKVLCATIGRPVVGIERGLTEELWVLTFSGEEDEHSWRMVEDFPLHSPTSDEMCIDGALYYGAFIGQELTEPGIIRFDVTSEALDLIKGPENANIKFLTSSKMTSYKGKLAILFNEDRRSIVMWILEDAANAEWSKLSFDLPSVFGFTTELDLQLFNATNAGEIILAPVFVRASTFRVVYYDPEKDTFKKIEMEGITESEIPHEVENWWYCRTVSVFPGQVENLLFLK